MLHSTSSRTSLLTRPGGFPVYSSSSFARDAEEQVRWRLEQDREDWAQGLKQALRTARTLLQSTPRLAKPEAYGLRRLLLGRLPLFLWYGLDERARTVIWLRLFHVRQAQARGLSE